MEILLTRGGPPVYFQPEYSVAFNFCGSGLFYISCLLGMLHTVHGCWKETNGEVGEISRNIDDNDPPRPTRMF